MKWALYALGCVSLYVCYLCGTSVFTSSGAHTGYIGGAIGAGILGAGSAIGAALIGRGERNQSKFREDGETV
jgi:hypothetical protein